MKVGMLTAPFGNEPLETVLDFAEEASIQCLEVIAHPGSRHINPAKLTPARAGRIREAVAERGLEISSLAYYTNTCDPKHYKAVQTHARKAINAAAHTTAARNPFPILHDLVDFFTARPYIVVCASGSFSPQRDAPELLIYIHRAR
jgi:sugar phosphate isomerase/epimerase